MSNAATKRMKCKEKKVEAHQCFCKTTQKYKFAYDNIVTAMNTAAIMSKKYPQYNYTIYECGKCGWIHVGRMPDGSVYMMGGYSVRVEHGNVQDLAAH